MNAECCGGGRRLSGGMDTRLIHAGDDEHRVDGAVTTPIFQSAMHEFGGETSYDDVRYIRMNNSPSHKAVQDKLAAISGAEAALVTGSGMAAISTSLLTVLSSGDHLLAMDNLYGGTHSFLLEEFKRFGIGFTFVDGSDPDQWFKGLQTNTKAFYVETMTNPLLRVPDFEAVVKFAKEHGLVSMIDNTFATPINFRPIEHGFDLSLHSASKYLNGHADIVAGVVIGNSELVGKINHRMIHFGGSLDPHACFLLHRGLKTLSLRMRKHNENGLRVARFLDEHAAVTHVNYPGLASHPNHATASRMFEGFSGILSFELAGGAEAAERFIEKLDLALHAPSLGAPSTLAVMPARASHLGLSPEERARVGISDSLIRMSVGLEEADDLIRDLQGALESIAESVSAL